MSSKILICDFDGTMTRRDFYQLVLKRVSPGTPDYWGEYLAGKRTHFDAINAVFGAYRPGEPALVELISGMELDPDLFANIKDLKEAGWSVTVASAGCSWYIRKLLGEAASEITIHANPGVIDDERLLMVLPRESPFFSPTTGIDKAGVVRHALDSGALVAFAGDGPPDVEPSLLVPEGLRFATGFLAGELNCRGMGYRRFDRWSEVATALLLTG